MRRYYSTLTKKIIASRAVEPRKYRIIKILKKIYAIIYLKREKTLQEALERIKYAQAIFAKKGAENEMRAIDGKTIKYSEYVPAGENKTVHKAVYIVSAWAHSPGGELWSGKAEEKSNEITATSELSDLLDLKGMIITVYLSYY